MITFNDGMSFDTEGTYRVVHEPDGWYFVGHGMLLPVDSAAEGYKFMDEQIKLDAGSTTMPFTSNIDVDNQAEIFDFLDNLRESGVTNMFGARPYIQEEFDLDGGKASLVLGEWMRTFEERHPRPEMSASPYIQDGFDTGDTGETEGGP